MHFTYPDLVRHLYDPQSIALLPLPGEKGAQFSSYDRESKRDETTGHFINWGANEDQMGSIRKEGDNLVLAEMTGPGCIWRIWSADPKAGHIQIFLDGKSTPAVDLPFTSFFDGTTDPFNHPKLNYIAARGHNCFTPIPYQKSCKIVALPGWGAFYHVNYTTFPAGTTVPTFHLDLAAEDRSALDKANTAFVQRGKPPVDYSDQKIVEQTATVASGATGDIASLDGPRAIVTLRVKVEGLPAASDARDKLLRQLCLQITWDDDTKPAVWAPLGDFFGVSPGSGYFKSLMTSFQENGEFYSYWYMPFARKAHIQLVNESGAPQSVSFVIGHVTLDHPVEAYGRLHAKWHRDAFPHDELDRTIDWTLLKTQGRGRYVGTQLHIWNARAGWWGEGDEKFFIDGENFPSTFGTGSEDYFGYAWCDPDLFDRALHGQNEAQKGNTGNTSLHRWQLADNVPFQQSFDGSIEKYFSNRRPTLYAATVFWYLSADGTDPYDAHESVDERDAYWKDAATPLAPEGLIDADSMEVKHQTGGRLGIHVTDEYAKKLGLPAGRPLALWVEGKTGQTVEFKVHSMWYVNHPGRFHVIAHCVKGPGFGIIQPYWNGTKTGEPVDFYSPEVKDIDIDLGVYDVVPTIQLLKFEIVGSNSAAQPSNGFALDYLKLAP